MENVLRELSSLYWWPENRKARRKAEKETLQVKPRKAPTAILGSRSARPATAERRSGGAEEQSRAARHEGHESAGAAHRGSPEARGWLHIAAALCLLSLGPAVLSGPSPAAGRGPERAPGNPPSWPWPPPLWLDEAGRPGPRSPPSGLGLPAAPRGPAAAAGSPNPPESAAKLGPPATARRDEAPVRALTVCREASGEASSKTPWHLLQQGLA